MSDDYQKDSPFSKSAVKIYEELRAARPLGNMKSLEEIDDGDLVLLNLTTYNKAVEERIKAGTLAYALHEGGACVRRSDIVEHFSNPFNFAAAAQHWPYVEYKEDPYDIPGYDDLE